MVLRTLFEFVVRSVRRQLHGGTRLIDRYSFIGFWTLILARLGTGCFGSVLRIGQRKLVPAMLILARLGAGCFGSVLQTGHRELVPAILWVALEHRCDPIHRLVALFLSLVKEGANYQSVYDRAVDMIPVHRIRVVAEALARFQTHE